MSRYQHIESVAFGETDLPLPVSAKFSRSARQVPAGSDSQQFATSVETDLASVTAEVVIRGTAVAEGLAIGQKADLAVAVRAAQDGAPARDVTLAGAVLVAVELSYQQTAVAQARLVFVTEADDGNEDPFSAEDRQ